jgi:hypothetical protein
VNTEKSFGVLKKKEKKNIKEKVGKGQPRALGPVFHHLFSLKK